MESPAPPAPAAPPEPPPRTRAPRFDPPNILWYFGAISATFAANAVVGDTGAAHRGVWILLVALVFVAGAATLSAAAFRLGWWVPGGVLAASAVALVPGAMVGFEHLVGVWPKHPNANAIDAFHDFSGAAFAIAAVTVVAGLVGFWLVRFGFVLLPVAVAALLGIELFLPVIVSSPSFGDHMTTLIAIGAAFVVIGMLLDARRHRNAAFWWHVVGLAALANGLVYYVGVNPFGHFSGAAFAIAAVTVVAGLVAYWLVRFGFVLLPVAVAGIIGIELLLPVLVSRPGFGDHMTTLIVAGAAFVVIGMLLDARRHRSAAFWWHVVGLFSIANGLVYYVGVNPVLPGNHSAVWAWVTMLVVGAVLVVAAFPVGRATWAVFGLAGIYSPALHYVDEASGSWRYPLLMIFVSLGLIVVGVLLDLAGPAWPQRLARPVMRPRT